MIEFHIIIPARLRSTRLSEKLLRPVADKILLQHTYERALEAGAKSLTVATDHDVIAQAMRAVGADVLMTSDQHETGTDRLAEAVDLLGVPDDAIVVNVQGDEPLIPTSLIHQVAYNLSKNPSAAMATLYVPLDDAAELLNPGIVKVVFTTQGKALYFSRAAIPFDRDQAGSVAHAYHRHLGIYAYRAGFLRAYQGLQPAPMEALEKLEQLRALYHGYEIHIARAERHCPVGVDTEEDLANIRLLFEESASV